MQTAGAARGISANTRKPLNPYHPLPPRESAEGCEEGGACAQRMENNVNPAKNPCPLSECSRAGLSGGGDRSGCSGS